MGYKRCTEANDFEGLSLNKAKRFACNNERVSLADIITPRNTFGNSVISDDVNDEDGFYNIPWYDPLEVDTTSEFPYVGENHIHTSGHFNSCSSEDDTGSGDTSLSPVSSFVPPDDAHLASVPSPRKSVPIGPKHQAVIPIWCGLVNNLSKLGTCNNGGAPSHLESFHTINDTEERLMGTSMFSMHDSSFYSSINDKGGEGRKECRCLDCGSIGCVQQHVREARENMRKTLGEENFVKLGFCDMGEDVALKWTKEEEYIFHNLVYSNPASLGRNFWKHLSAAFHSRSSKEIVSYYFNVFVLRRRAAQNRDRFLDIDSDDDECPATTRNARIFGFGNSEDDSAVESPGDEDVHAESQDNYSDEEDSDHGSSDDGSDEIFFGFSGYDMGNTTKFDGGVNQRSIKCMESSQDDWSNPTQHTDGSIGSLKDGIGVQDDSCMSFECDSNMGVSFCSHQLVDGRSSLQDSTTCDKSPHMHAKLDLSSDEMDRDYLFGTCNAKEWFSEYSTCQTTDADLSDFLPTSNLIEEFFGHSTPDKKARGD